MTSNALHYLYRKAKTKLRLQLWNIEQNCPPFQLECWTKKSPRVHLGLDDSVHAKIQKRGASHVSLYLDVRNHNLEKKFLFRVRLSSSINLRVFENVQKCLILTKYSVPIVFQLFKFYTEIEFWYRFGKKNNCWPNLSNKML